MAWLEQRPTGYFHISFRIGNERIKRSLGTKKRERAEAKLARFHETLELVHTGRLPVPADTDIATFLLSDGNVTRPIGTNACVTLEDFLGQFKSSLPPDSMEANSLATMQYHMNHLKRILGDDFPLERTDLATLQTYVNARAHESNGRGSTVAAATIKKEIATLRAIWNWGQTAKLVDGPFPNRGVRYPKEQDGQPFRTRQDIERILTGNPQMAEHQEQELWDALYLNRSEIAEVLATITASSLHPFIQPMCATAAYTGARRSELIRAMIEDVDFSAGVICVREKKRSRSRNSVRTVPITPELEQVLRQWLRKHPGGRSLFTLGTKQYRTRKSRNLPLPLTPDEATHHLNQSLSSTRWAVVRGWHVFRHSFISNCASAGVDQRMIDAWVGHQTEAMRRRYTHLFPRAQRVVLASVFSTNGH